MTSNYSRTCIKRSKVKVPKFFPLSTVIFTKQADGTQPVCIVFHLYWDLLSKINSMSVSRINISTLSSQFLNALQIIFLFHHVSHLRESWKELRSCYQSQLGLYDKSLLVVYYSPPFKYINTLTVLILHSLVISRRSLIPSSEGKLIFWTMPFGRTVEKRNLFNLGFVKKLRGFSVKRMSLCEFFRF